MSSTKLDTAPVKELDDEDIEILFENATTLVFQVIATGQVVKCLKHGVH